MSFELNLALKIARKSNMLIFFLPIFPFGSSKTFNSLRGNIFWKGREFQVPYVGCHVDLVIERNFKKASSIISSNISGKLQ